MGENERDLNLSDVLDAGFARTAEEMPEDVTENAAQPVEGAAADTAAVQEVPETAQEAVTETAAEMPVETQEQPIQSTQPAQSVQNAESSLINEMRAQNAALTAQVQQLVEALKQSQTAVQEQSAQAEEAVNQAAEITLPRLNMQELQYMSPEEQTAAQEQYQTDMLNALRQIARQEMSQEMTPIRADYEARTREAAISAAKDQIYNDPRFPDFREHDAEIDSFIGSVPAFEQMEPGQARLLGGLINRGLRSDPNKKMTTDELVTAVLANPDAQKALEIRRAQNIQKQNESLPKMSASQGMTGAAAVPEHKPQTKDELFAAIDKRWQL